MNFESIREIRTVRGEEEINDLLRTGKWKMNNMGYDDEAVVAVLVKVKE